MTQPPQPTEPFAQHSRLADRNQAFYAHEVASWTGGRRSVNEVGIELLHHWFLPERRPPLAITAPRSLGWFRSGSPTPCWASFAAWLTVTGVACWSCRSWSCSP